MGTQGSITMFWHILDEFSINNYQLVLTHNKATFLRFWASIPSMVWSIFLFYCLLWVMSDESWMMGHESGVISFYNFQNTSHVDKQWILTESFPGHLVFGIHLCLCFQVLSPFLVQIRFWPKYTIELFANHVKMQICIWWLLVITLPLLTSGGWKVLHLWNQVSKPHFPQNLMLKNENVYKKAVLIMFSFLDAVVSLAPTPWFGQQITSIIQSHFEILTQLCFDWYLETRWNGLIQQKI